ncbi:MAG: enoyl-CoA hydratase/isomerase family protein [Pseudomonadota bacterium]
MIEARHEGPLGWIVLNDPEKHNVLSRAAMADIAEALVAHQDGGCRVIILTARGKSFSAGASLKEVAAEDWTVNPLSVLADAIEACPLPVIAGVQGNVFGGGVDMALACDYRIGIEGIRAHVPAVRLGIHYPEDGLARATRLLGLQATRRLFLFSEPIYSEDLLRTGFLDQVVPSEEALLETLERKALHIAGCAPLALQGMKATLRDQVNGKADPEVIRARIAACFASEDHKEGLAAQREKRKPAFKGR